MRFVTIAVALLCAGSASAADLAATLTTTPQTVVTSGNHTYLAVDNESASVAVACSFFGTPAVNTAGSWTIAPGATRISGHSHYGASAVCRG